MDTPMKNLLGALLKAQKEFPALVKDGSNPAFRSRYATLSAVQEAAFPVLHKHGLVVLQSVRTELTEVGLVVYVGATLYHVESGESTVQELGLTPNRTDPQGVGSAITYGRRYMLMTLLGLSADDDDGNGASMAGQRVVSAGRSMAGSAPRVTRQEPDAHGDAPPIPAPTVNRPAWKSINEAVDWAMEKGHFDSETAARSELKRVLQRLYPGRDGCKPHELPAVFDAWFTEVEQRRVAIPA